MSQSVQPSQAINLILHPGYPKCGSSAIQSCLYANAKSLQKQGFYLPDAHFNFSFMPFRFQLGKIRQAIQQTKAVLMGEKQPSSLFQVPIGYLEKVIDQQAYSTFEQHLQTVIAAARRTDCHTILLSAENLAGAVGRVYGLHQVIAGCFESVHIIFYFRRQDDWMLSSWQQWLYKKGWNLDQTIQHWLEVGLPNYAAILDCFEKTYHHPRIEAVPLHKKAFHTGDLLIDFCQRAGINSRDFDFSQVYTNRSLNPFLCQAIAVTSPKANDLNSNRLRNLLDDYLVNDSVTYTNRRSFLGPQQRSQIMEHFRRENQQLLATYCPTLTYEDFAAIVSSPPPSPTAISGNDQQQIDDLDLIQTELIMALLQRQQKHLNVTYAALAIASISLLLWVMQAIFALRG